MTTFTTTKTATTKTFQYLSNEGWTDMPKGAFKDCDAAGVPIRIKWSTGALKVIRNPESVYAIPQLPHLQEKKKKKAPAAKMVVPYKIVSKDKEEASEFSLIFSPAMAKKLAAAGYAVKKMVTKKRPKLIDLSIIGASPSPAAAATPTTKLIDMSLIGA